MHGQAVGTGRESSLIATWRHRDAKASQSALIASEHELTLLSLKPRAQKDSPTRQGM